MNAALAVCLVILDVTFFVGGAPVEKQSLIESTTHTPNCNNNEDEQFYDQRQNGTENYRIHVNGVVVLVAPADAVLQAAQLSNLPMESNLSGLPSVGTQTGLKPKPRPPSPSDQIPSEETQHMSAHPSHSSPSFPSSSSSSSSPSSSYSPSDQTSGKESLNHGLAEVKQFRGM